ncbi:7-carboxy-7-deazaguanine synthase QueE [Inmirania thermothiophila]|uniref:7-carboxy-7-deazaguanine synthase n=1 Tax=Inmirania thermothiophila TaxID=1750597 RepID=A0A3N1XX52_9GAMM|nr:7-carboxy-7-deazaguanine synthase QueE [Inmirania thermothiophila]ROR29792.1 7-carboxy-7-deazaguanine synthase [Inmirania thermothiophila]
MAQLRVTEIFRSLQGEGLAAGLPTVFVRLTGCPLRCRYCDTAYAFSGGETMSVAAVVEAVRALPPAPAACVTGGEPLAQAGCRELLSRLCDAGYAVSLETSGALDIGGIDPRVTVVMDLKTPGSGESGRNRWANLGRLRPQDQVKLVLTDRADYEWAREVVVRHRLDARCTVLLAPAWGELEAATLAEWILADALPVRLQLQLHKLLWGEVRGR